MVFLSKTVTAVGGRECFWIFEANRAPNAQIDPQRTRLPLRSLLWFQRNVTAAALAIDAYQNLLVRLQFFAGSNQVPRILNRLLVHLLNHVPFAQASLSSRRIGINFRNH